MTTELRRTPDRPIGEADAAPFMLGGAALRREVDAGTRWLFAPRGTTARARDAAQLPPLVALVGCDGSGKSTVGAALLAWMQERGETELCHLGKQTGNIGRAIARWPIVGGRLGKAVGSKTKSAKERGVGAFTALTVYLFSMRRVRRFRRMLALRERGVAILADRFPQVAVPGPLDGPELARVRPTGAFGRMLARRERRYYHWMASHRPDLVIRLNVDLATAIARKPDHSRSSLGAKVGDVPRLSFDGAPIVDIDATQPLAVVLDHAKRAVAIALGHG